MLPRDVLCAVVSGCVVRVACRRNVIPVVTITLAGFYQGQV